MQQEQSTSVGPLASARERRASLKAALSAVEIAAASAAARDEWRPELRTALDLLRDAFDRHVQEVEHPGGLLDVLCQEAPHLSMQVGTVKEEHPRLEAQIAATIELTTTDASPREVRDAVLSTLSGVARHRQNGADLVYQAYSVDIGGGE